jgi:mRNA interferase RelE/StbE
LSYRVELENRAKKELLGLPRDIQSRLAEALDDLQKNPRPPGSKKLTGQEGYRVRKGNYRILYIIDDRESLVRVYRIGHRREIYR